MIVILKDDQLHFLVFSLAVLFTLTGFGIFHYQQNELKAQAVRDYRNVSSLERRFDRAEHTAQDLEFIYEYAIQVADK